MISRGPAGWEDLSPIGLGAWALGRTGWGGQTDTDSRRTVARAVELGINWIDTAAVYGNGHAEALVGEVLEELGASGRPLIFTKGGVRVCAAGATRRDLSPRALRSDCEGSLRRLGLDTVDLYQLHWPPAGGERLEDAWSTLVDLAREGKARWIGVSNFSVEELDVCDAIRPVDCVQPPLSLLARGATADVIPWAAQRGVSVLTYSPLASGLLSGRFSVERVAALDPADWRGRRPAFQPPALAAALSVVELMRPLARRLDATVAQLALAWVLHQPGVTGAIAGARRPGQVEDSIGAAGLHLDADDLRELAAMVGGEPG